MASAAIEALQADPGTDAILLVSKPPAPDVARTVTPWPGDKPLVAALIGLVGPLDEAEAAGRERTVTTAPTLEQGVAAALHAVGQVAPDPADGPAGTGCRGLSPTVDRCRADADPGPVLGRHPLLRGAAHCSARSSATVYSNTPIDKRLGLPAPAGPTSASTSGKRNTPRAAPTR